MRLSSYLRVIKARQPKHYEALRLLSSICIAQVITATCQLPKASAQRTSYLHEERILGIPLDPQCKGAFVRSPRAGARELIFARGETSSTLKRKETSLAPLPRESATAFLGNRSYILTYPNSAALCSLIAHLDQANHTLRHAIFSSSSHIN